MTRDSVANQESVTALGLEIDSICWQGSISETIKQNPFKFRHIKLNLKKKTMQLRCCIASFGGIARLRDRSMEHVQLSDLLLNNSTVRFWIEEDEILESFNHVRTQKRHNLLLQMWNCCLGLAIQ
jgi:hypothetical protein